LRPVCDPTPASPRLMAGLSRSANAGAIGGNASRAALARVGRAGSLGFLGGLFGRLGGGSPSGQYGPAPPARKGAAWPAISPRLQTNGEEQRGLTFGQICPIKRWRTKLSESVSDRKNHKVRMWSHEIRRVVMEQSRIGGGTLRWESATSLLPNSDNWPETRG